MVGSDNPAQLIRRVARYQPQINAAVIVIPQIIIKRSVWKSLFTLFILTGEIHADVFIAPILIEAVFQIGLGVTDQRLHIKRLGSLPLQAYRTGGALLAVVAGLVRQG